MNIHSALDISLAIGKMADKKSTFNYYLVAPLVNFSVQKKDCFFTYKSRQKDLEKSLTEISFGRKKIHGFVLEKTSPPSFPVKEISRVIEKKFLDEKQLLLAKKIAEFYLADLPSVLKLFPKKESTVKKITPIKKVKKKENLSKKDIPPLTQFQKNATEKILTSKEKKFLLFGPASSGKTEIILRLIEKNIKKKKQSLVIIPEIFLSFQEIERYKKRFGQKVALFHSKISKNEKNEVIKNCQNGKTKIIISTKSGLFLPFEALGLIAIDEEQDSSHKKWQGRPQYHSKDVAIFLAENSNAKLILVSATPSIESFHIFSKSKECLVKIPPLRTKKFQIKRPQIDFLDLRENFFKNKKEFLLPRTKKEIEKVLGEKKMIFVLVSRSGKNKLTICGDCKKIFSCPVCQSPIIQIGNRYHCSRCNFKKNIFSKCPFCGSFRLKNLGAGTEKIADELKTNFPKVNIFRADKNIFKEKNAQKNLFEKINQKKVDILIGTQSIAKGFDFPNLGLAIVVNAESWSGKNDYLFDEKWLANLFQLAGRLNRSTSDQQGKIIIQTFKTKNPLFEYLKKWDWLDFAKNEVASRKPLDYPPHCVLIKLSFNHNKKEKVEKNINLVYNKLEKEKINVSEPYQNFKKNRIGFFEKNLLIKTKKFPNGKLTKILKNLDGNWTIDIHPKNIF